MKLTQRVIENLVCPLGKKDVLKSDNGQEGHYVRIGKSARKGSLDHKSSLAQYTKDGKKRRILVGSCSAISLAQAREATRAILGDVAKGRDPAADRKVAALEAKREALTLKGLLGQWAKLHLTGKRPNYSAAAESALRRVFAKHLDSPAAALDRATVVRVLDDLAKDGKDAMAGATKRYGSALYGWAVKRGSVAFNPFERVPVAPTVRRDVTLSNEKIVGVWRGTEGPGSFAGIVRTVSLTGQRREEVAGMTWSELDEDLSTWTIPAARAKNGKPHVVPLSEEVRTLLCAQPRREGTDLVFPGGRGVFSGWSKSKARLDRWSGVTGWTLHDLRRTTATGMAELGVAPHVVEAVLNHASGHKAGVAGVYNQARYATEKRRALELWGAHVAALVEGREAAANITAFRARGA